MKKNYYENIIAGAGAAGLYCGCVLGGDTLILEKTSRPGRKLLASGSGQCNVTHGGSIKDFIEHYGPHGRNIRGVLQRYSNLRLVAFFEELEVPLCERENGKIFPSSMKSMDVLQALLRKIEEQSVELNCDSPVVKITPPSAESSPDKSSAAEIPGESIGDRRTELFTVETPGRAFSCRNLIIATGGCSYPKTGSDGKMFDVLRGDLGIEIVKPSPALTPVYSFTLNFLAPAPPAAHDPAGTPGTSAAASNPAGTPAPPISGPEAAARFKRNFPGSSKSPQSYMCEELGLPKRFAQKIAEELGISKNKVSQLSGSQIQKLAEALTAASFTVSGLAGFSEAMVTKGGVSLAEVDMTRMAAKKYVGLYFIGEALDVDGDTGGYNLQFAFSSAWAAAEDILRKADYR
ncbi:MAG: NAD(P)/FAD-dependent oxidoreductase [Firmicutes bacterium]|nr:NAD(P)/FAD-dependent oxidoreductase [Bacillota bacterium]